MAVLILFFLLLLLPNIIQLNTANAQSRNARNSIVPGSSLSPNTNPYWLSESGQFAFGFYQYGSGFAVGIWFENIDQKTVVWTAKRDDPPFPADVLLLLNTQGRLVVQPKQGQEIIIAEVSQSALSASMLDSGNFVLYNSSSGIIWQSFDFPTDTILPGQRLVQTKKLVPNISETNHTGGNYFYIIMQEDGNLVQYPAEEAQPETAYWSTGTGTYLAGKGVTLNLDINGRLYLRNASGIDAHNISDATGALQEAAAYRATIDADGIFRLYSHALKNRSDDWSIEWSSSEDKCRPSGLCGFNSYCEYLYNETSSALCHCPSGFDFIDPGRKNLGCRRSNNLDVCTAKGEPVSIIVELSDVSWYAIAFSNFSSVNKDACKDECFKDCNCEAALFKNRICRKVMLPLRFGRRKQLDVATSTFLKIGVESKVPMEGKRKRRVVRIDVFIASIASITCLTFAFLVLFVVAVLIHRSRIRKYTRIDSVEKGRLIEDVNLKSFTYEELKIASNNFKDELGRGACGTVYKGVLSNGNTTVAIKRLEKIVSEGEREFQNEMKTIGKTHHKNLVQLLGFCHEGSNILLIYEYMSHGSLADFLFKSRLKTDWEGRIEIALDIARGILYLHEECKTQIIHCDIKPENILMDENGCAKISDFGLAKLLMPNQTKTYTGIRGTRGYVGPEWWHQNSPITVKADVYSFGVMFLEIIFCRRSLDMNAPENEIVLPYWVYDCFMAREIEKLVKDEEVEIKMLERMVKVGLWCIQDDPSLRPSMKKVVLMLEGSVDIPAPPCRPSSF